jgi:coenzyme F420-reducing hydrogenase delta subunit
LIPYILKAFEGGTDGTLVAGCRIGDCHYIFGNIKAERMLIRLKVLLRRLGLEDERLRLQRVSTGEGQLFAKTIEDMVSDLKEEDPLPLKQGEGCLREIAVSAVG